jgi:hypothetical protein
MILRYAHLSRHPAVFQAMTVLTIAAFDDLIAELLPACVAAKQHRLARLIRRRAIGGGHHADLCWTKQVLLTVVWLRTYSINEVLAYLMGVSDSTISRVLSRMLALLEAAGKNTMRLPDPGRKRRRQWPAATASQQSGWRSSVANAADCSRAWYQRVPAPA